MLDAKDLITRFGNEYVSLLDENKKLIDAQENRCQSCNIKAVNDHLLKVVKLQDDYISRLQTDIADYAAEEEMGKSVLKQNADEVARLKEQNEESSDIIGIQKRQITKCELELSAIKAVKI